MSSSRWAPCSMILPPSSTTIRSALHGREPVRDHERGAVAHQPVERVLHERLRLVIQGGRPRRGSAALRPQESPRDGRPLPLACRASAPLADECRSPRAAEDELVGVGRPGGVLDLVPPCVEPSVPDVLATVAPSSVSCGTG
ncbi:MAG: hypothetical protein WKH64_05130 [Chloroflexia bacterium]